MFENYFARNYNCPSAYDDIISKTELLSSPSLEEEIEQDYKMPPIYDDYNDESGFGETMTLSNDDPTILESNKNQVALCFNELFLYNIILHRKWVRFKCALYLLPNARYHYASILLLM